MTPNMSALDDLSQIAAAAEQLLTRIRDERLQKPLESLRRSSKDAARAWSGSNLGYHATVYCEDLQPKPPEAQFSAEWGLEERWPVHSPHPCWRIMDHQAVIDEIVSRAGGYDPKVIDAQLAPIRVTFGDLKENAISILSAVRSVTTDDFLQTKLQEIKKLNASDPSTVAYSFLPKGQIFTRDTLALTQGLHVAPHQSVLALSVCATATETAIDDLHRAARLSASHLERVAHQRGTASARSAVDSEDWHDVMQVCLNGHQITACAQSEPTTRQNFCNKCGEKTIDACEDCGAPIRGYRHIAGEVISPSYEMSVPKYCTDCGTAYPWQQSAIENLKEIFKQSDLSSQDVEIIEAALPDVLRDTPKTESSSLKLKGVLAKVGKPVYDISVKVITDVASETARKILGLP
jgi:hypothetical protein